MLIKWKLLKEPFERTKEHREKFTRNGICKGSPITKWMRRVVERTFKVEAILSFEQNNICDVKCEPVFRLKVQSKRSAKNYFESLTYSRLAATKCMVK